MPEMSSDTCVIKTMYDINSLEYHLFFDKQFNGREISKHQVHYDKENSTNSFEGKMDYM